MNILGHSLISVRVFRGFREFRGDRKRFQKDLIIGTLLPESCPFIADNPFAFNEIHEGGEV